MRRLLSPVTFAVLGGRIAVARRGPVDQAFVREQVGPLL